MNTLKTALIIKIGYIFLVISLGATAMNFFIFHSSEDTVICLVSVIIWIIGLLFWHKVLEQEEQDGK